MVQIKLDGAYCMKRILIFSLLFYVVLGLSVYGQKVSFSPQEGFDFFVTVRGDGTADKIIYVATENSTRDSIVCVDAHSGRTIWSEKTPIGTVDVGPVVVGSTVVYMGDGSYSTAYGLDAFTGHRKWTAHHKSSFLMPGAGQVYLNDYNGVLAIDADSGKVTWTYEPGGSGSIDRMILHQGKLYTDRYVVDAQNGKLIQKLSVSQPRSFAASADSVFYATNDGTLVALNAASGKTLWTTPINKPYKPVQLAANRSYLAGAFYDGYAFAAHNGILMVLDASKGSVLWQKTITSQRNLLPNPIGLDGRNVFLLRPGDQDRAVRLVALDQATGESHWSVDIADTLSGPPAIVGGEVYLSNDQGTIYVFNSETGQIARKLMIVSQGPSAAMEAIKRLQRQESR